MRTRKDVPRRFAAKVAVTSSISLTKTLEIVTFLERMPAGKIILTAGDFIRCWKCPRCPNFAHKTNSPVIEKFLGQSICK